MYKWTLRQCTSLQFKSVNLLPSKHQTLSHFTYHKHKIEQQFVIIYQIWFFTLTIRVKLKDKFMAIVILSINLSWMVLHDNPFLSSHTLQILRGGVCGLPFIVEHLSSFFPTTTIRAIWTWFFCCDSYCHCRSNYKVRAVIPTV